MIPISLIVSLEFVKLFQAYFIEKDIELFNQKRNCWAKVQTSTINEELGQVEYIFSDKTGTLTCNQMELKYLIVGDSLYGDQETKNIVDETQELGRIRHSIFTFRDTRLSQLLSNKLASKPAFKKLPIVSLDGKKKFPINNEYDLAQEYFTLLATAHECLAEKDEKTGEL